MIFNKWRIDDTSLVMIRNDISVNLFNYFIQLQLTLCNQERDV